MGHLRRERTRGYRGPGLLVFDIHRHRRLRGCHPGPAQQGFVVRAGECGPDGWPRGRRADHGRRHRPGRERGLPGHRLQRGGEYAVAAATIALFVRAPRAAGPGQASGGGALVALTDRPFLGLVAVNTVFALSSLLLATALPAFALKGLHAPSWLAASVLAGNAIAISLLSPPVASLLRGFRRTRVLAAAGLLWAAWGLLFALLRPGHLAWVIPLLIGATLLYTAADVMHAPISTALAATVAPVASRGRYLAAFQYSFAFASIIAPVFFTSLTSVGIAGPWIGIAILDGCGIIAILALERHLEMPGAPEETAADAAAASSSALPGA